MAIRTVIKLGNEDAALHKHCRAVTAFDSRLHQLLDDLAETMTASNGMGLAAPQVGVLKRCCVIDTEEGVLELVNPEIIAAQGEITAIEGCLSVPGRAGRVVRPQQVTVRAQNRNGDTIEVTGEDMRAVCMCHEIDHLNGIVYVDKMIEDCTEEMRQKGAIT
jgi:peptide deformylase